MKRNSVTNKAILLVAFGTSVPEAAKALEDVERLARERFAGVEIRWAYTSRIIRSRFAALGKPMDSPEMALSRLMEDGFTHVALLSLHVVPGEEFNDLSHNAMRFAEMKGGFDKLSVARPLLGNYEDMARVADELARKFPTGENSGRGVLFVGHGNMRHPSDAIYFAMDSIFKERNRAFFVGTVQGRPTADEIIPKLLLAGIRKVKLVPLMTVSGEHARKDMAGDGAESWKSALSKNGIESETVLSGLAEYPEIVRVWLDHLDEVFSKL